VRDPAGDLAGQRGRVGAADQQVPGVEAERDRRTVQHPLHFRGVLHHRADVRVQDREHAVLGGQRAQPVQVAQQRGPAVLIQRGTRVVPGLAAVGGQHQGARSGVGVSGQDGPDLRDRVVPRHVQDDRDEAADRCHVVLPQDLGGTIGLARQESGRPQLGRGQPHLRHLG